MVGRLAVVSGVSLRAAREAPRFKIQHEPDTNNDNTMRAKKKIPSFKTSVATTYVDQTVSNKFNYSTIISIKDSNE